MSYNKRTWATGNVVGAVDLNRMEQGIEDAGGMVAPTFSDDGQMNFSCDLSFGVVNSAVKSGKCCYAFLSESVYTLSEYYEDSSIVFAKISVGGGVFSENFVFNSDGTITFTYNQYPE